MRRRWAGLVGVALLTRSLGGQAAPPPVPQLADLPASVRVAGLGGAAVGLPGYAAVVFDNPSAIGPIRVLSLEGAFARLPDDRWYTSGAAAARYGPVAIGGGYRYLRFAEENPVTDNLLSTAAISWRLKGVHLGASGKYVSVEDSSGTVFRTLTQDLGVTLAFFDIAALGLVFTNLGRTPLSGPRLELPSSTRLGFSFNLIDSYSSGRLLLVTETIWADDTPRRTVIGIEGGAVFGGVGVVGRIGTGAQAPGSGTAKTSYGGSVVLSRARIDYAFQPRRAAGRGVHLFGVRWTP